MIDANYRKFIYYMLHRMGVGHNDIEELTQQVMVTLTVKLKQYKRERGKFRSWLRVVVKNEVLGNLRKYKSQARTLERYSNEVEVHEEGSSELDQIIVEEWERLLYTQAMERVKGQASQNAIKVFVLTREGLSVEEISEQVGVTVNSVYSLRKIVKQQLVQEVKNLKQELEE